MKKVKSKLPGIILVLIGIMAAYLIVTGKLNENINKITDKTHKTDTGNKGNDEGYSAEVPEGMIEDYPKKFNWVVEPLVDTYNPDSKIPENGVYGYTVDERMWQEECAGQVEEHLEKAVVDPDKCRETDVYNKSSVHGMNEKIDITPYKCSVTVRNMTIHDNFDGFSEEYFMDDLYEAVNKYLNGQENVYEYVYDSEDNLTTKLMENEHVRFVTFDIEVEAHGNWVQEMDIVPDLLHIKEDGDMLAAASTGYSFNNERDFEITKPVYMDIGLYDLKNHDNKVITSIPMRKGECMKFTCGYLVPEHLISECMLTFNTPYYTDYYYDPFRVLVKADES